LQPPLIVDLVPIDEITAAPPKPTPKVEEEPPKPEAQPEPPKPAEAAPPKPEPTPPPPKPEPLPPPPPKEEKVAPPPPKVPPPPPKPQPPKPKKDDMAQLEQLLKDMAKKQPQKPQAQQPSPSTTTAASPNNQTAAISDRATMTELDAIRRHFESCWRIDPGKEGVENLSAEIRVFINADGTVQRADILNMTRFFADTQFRTFANSARIAVLSCSGVPISPQHYNELKEMVLNFSPQGRIN
jgi:hypothetical protein